jgi:uncharacterized protein YecE (DUF72 family)
MARGQRCTGTACEGAQGSYSVRTLRRWADATLTWQAQRREVFIYFDNDQKAAAPRDAERLTRMIAD